MSRWLSPEKAARRAERAAKQAEQRRREIRRMWLMIGGIALVSVGLTVADFFWLRYRAKQRHERRYHRSGRTNAPPSVVQLDGSHQATNHE
jgi:heme/copper-type cytochrome/quinol oxidase subunit 2